MLKCFTNLSIYQFLKMEILIALAVFLTVSSAQQWSFKWEDCAGKNSIMDFKEFDFKPKPLVVQKTNKYDVTFSGVLKEDLTEDTMIQINIARQQVSENRVDSTNI